MEKQGISSLVQLFTSEELAERLGVRIETICNWRKQGYGPAYIKFSKGKRGAVRYRATDIQAWEESRMRIVPSVEQNVEAVHGSL
jgi:hypothetical protein